MPNQSYRPRIGGLAAVAWILAVIPACQQQRGARPYVSARPSFSLSTTELPLRLGGYAGANYGRGRPLPPVEPVEDVDPLR